MSATAWKTVGGVLVVVSLFLFGVVGIPVTETISPGGYSESWSWGHVFGYLAVAFAGAGCIWVGQVIERRDDD